MMSRMRGELNHKIVRQMYFHLFVRGIAACCETRVFFKKQVHVHSSKLQSLTRDGHLGIS